MSVLGHSMQCKQSPHAAKGILLMKWLLGHRTFLLLVSPAPQPSCAPGSNWDSKEFPPVQAESGLSVFWGEGAGGTVRLFLLRTQDIHSIKRLDRNSFN